MRQLLKLILVVPLLACVISQAQNVSQIDSLKRLLPSQKIDTLQINLFNKIAFLYSATDSVNTFLYANQAQEKATKINYKKGIAKALEAKGNLFISKTNGPKALFFFKEASNIWSSINDELSHAECYRNMGQAYLVMLQQNNAIIELEKAEKIFLKYKNKLGLSTVYQTMGNVYRDKGNNEIAIDYFLKALKLEEDNKDVKSIGSIQNNLGRLMNETKNYPEALKYYTQSIQTSKAIGDLRLIGIAQLNLCNVYAVQLNYAKAIELLLDAKVNFTKSNFQRGVQICINNLGAINLRQGNYDTAIVYLKSSLAIAKENQTQLGVALVQQNIGYGYLKLKKFDESLRWFKDAEATAIKYGAEPFTYGEIYNHRSMLDSAVGNFESAFTYRSKYTAITEKTSGESVIKQVNELKTKYDVEKKELLISLLNKTDSIKSLEIANQQIAINKNLYDIASQKLALADAGLQLADDSLQLSIKNETILQNRLDSTQKEERIQDLNKQKRIQELEVNRKNITIIALSVFTVLILLLGYSFYKRRTLQQQATMQGALAKQQQQATIEIINAEEKERKRIAEDLHDGVGQLMTAAWLNLQALDNQMEVDNSQQYQLINKTLLLVDESCKEVRQVSHNMMPNALLRKGLVNAVKEFIGQINTGKLSINLQTEELQKALPSHVETILYRVIQESVNNVVKHAEATQLDISINQDEEGIDVMIEDNGKGFDTTTTRENDGIGLQNIRSRILYLKGTVNWDSSANNGTLVAIHIPTNV
jgi:two-component system NarL family sensor kinase